MIRKDLVKNVTDLRRDPISLFRHARQKDRPLYIFNRSQPLGVILSWEEYEKITQRLEDFYDAQELRTARETSSDLVPWEEARREIVD